MLACILFDIAGLLEYLAILAIFRFTKNFLHGHVAGGGAAVDDVETEAMPVDFLTRAKKIDMICLLTMTVAFSVFNLIYCACVY